MAHGMASRPAPSESVYAQVGGDSIHPTLKRASGLKGVETLPCSQQRVLKSLFGIGAGPQHPVAVAEKPGPVPVDQGGERNSVTRPSPSQGRPNFCGLAGHWSPITTVTHCMTRSGLEILR